jgi:hypothetical protein
VASSLLPSPHTFFFLSHRPVPSLFLSLSLARAQVNFRYTQRGNEHWKPRTDGTYTKGVPQTATAWTGEEWPAEKPKHDSHH